MKTEPAILTEPIDWVSCDTYNRDFEVLPEASGLYAIFGIDFGPYLLLSFPWQLLYIGISTNLKHRLSDDHLILRRARQQFQSVRRRFQTAPFNVAVRLEPLLVRKYNPPFNTAFRDQQ